MIGSLDLMGHGRTSLRKEVRPRRRIVAASPPGGASLPQGLSLFHVLSSLDPALNVCSDLSLLDVAGALGALPPPSLNDGAQAAAAA